MIYFRFDPSFPDEPAEYLLGLLRHPGESCLESLSRSNEIGCADACFPGRRAGVSVLSSTAAILFDAFVFYETFSVSVEDGPHRS